MARPGVVWYGEGLPEDVRSNVIEAVRAAQLLLVVGTSALVYPAARLVQLAQSAGAKVVEINVAETPVSAQVDLSWRASATAALPQLIQSA
jgi:NAD-dependent deacetylase